MSQRMITEATLTLTLTLTPTLALALTLTLTPTLRLTPPLIMTLTLTLTLFPFDLECCITSAKVSVYCVSHVLFCFVLFCFVLFALLKVQKFNACLGSSTPKTWKQWAKKRCSRYPRSTPLSKVQGTTIDRWIWHSVCSFHKAHRARQSNGCCRSGVCCTPAAGMLCVQICTDHLTCPSRGHFLRFNFALSLSWKQCCIWLKRKKFLCRGNNIYWSIVLVYVFLSIIFASMSSCRCLLVLSSSSCLCLCLSVYMFLCMSSCLVYVFYIFLFFFTIWCMGFLPQVCWFDSSR
jgi:hypothetical protein